MRGQRTGVPRVYRSHMASGRDEEVFFSELYSEDRIAAFEKLSGEGYIGSQGQAVTEVSHEVCFFARAKLDIDNRR